MMTNSPLQLPSDPPSWEKIHRRIDLVFGDQPNVGERHETVDWFRDLLGTDWRGFERRHPLAGWLEIDGPLEWRRMAEEVLDLPHAREIAKGLGGAQKATFDSALQTLYFTSGVRRSGRLVELFGIGRNQIIPDLRVHFRDRWVTLEQTVLQPSEPLENSWEFWFWLDTISRRRGRGRIGRVHITFDERLNTTDLLARTDEIEKHVLQIADTRAPGALNAVGLGLFEYDPHFGGELFVDTETVYDEVIENVGTSNEISRVLARSVMKASKQLRGHGATVFMARAPFLSLWSQEIASLDPSVMAAAREALVKTPCVSAILIYDRDGLRGRVIDGTHAADGYDRGIVASDYSGRKRWAVLINNPAAEVPLTAEECEDLVGPTMCW